jgi:uncharacterized protein YegL
MPIRRKKPHDAPLSATGMIFDNDDERTQRVLIALVLDTSESMSGTKIELLNRELAEMAEDLSHHVDLSGKAMVALITFGDGGVRAWRGSQPVPPGTSPFVLAKNLRMPTLNAGGVTPMVDAVELAISCVTREKADLKRRHLSYYRPLIWLISDGLPTDAHGHLSDDWKSLPARIARDEDEKHYVFFTVSAGDIDPQGDAVLDELAPDSHLRLEGLEFAAAMQLVSASAEGVQKGTIAEFKQRMRETFGQIQIEAT